MLSLAKNQASWASPKMIQGACVRARNALESETTHGQSARLGVRRPNQCYQSAAVLG